VRYNLVTKSKQCAVTKLSYETPVQRDKQFS